MVIFVNFIVVFDIINQSLVVFFVQISKIDRFIDFSIDNHIFPHYNIGISIKQGGFKTMKSTGMVRPIDELGRIVLPKEIRKNLNINPKDSVEIFTDGERIVLQKYEPACIFCQNADKIVYFEGKRICTECLAKLKQIL